MREVTVRLTNPDGLHARPAALFVKHSNKYESDIELIYNGNKINGKSIIGVMSLGAYEGEDITIVARGIDEEEAIADLQVIINSSEV